MWVCKDCADKTGWAYHLEVSYGLCELCERQKPCDDIHPRTEAKRGSLEGIYAERNARRQR